MTSTALGAGRKRENLTWLSIRANVSGPKAVAVLAIALLPCLQGVAESTNAAFRDNLDVLSNIVVSPLELVFPLAVCLVANSRFFGEVGRRYVANTRTRAPIESYLTAKIVSAGVVGSAVGFAIAMLPCLVAFGLWPLLGNPSVSPDVFGLTEAAATQNSFTRFSFSELLAISPGVYSLAYSLWVGVAGGCYAVIGVLALSIVPQRLLAIIVPFLIYIGQSVFASLAGDARVALMFSAFPFGLDQATATALVPNVTLFLAVMLASVITIRRSGRLRLLS